MSQGMKSDTQSSSGGKPQTALERIKYVFNAFWAAAEEFTEQLHGGANLFDDEDDEQDEDQPSLDTPSDDKTTDEKPLDEKTSEVTSLDETAPDEKLSDEKTTPESPEEQLDTGGSTTETTKKSEPEETVKLDEQTTKNESGSTPPDTSPQAWEKGTGAIRRKQSAKLLNKLMADNPPSRKEEIERLMTASKTYTDYTEYVKLGREKKISCGEAELKKLEELRETLEGFIVGLQQMAERDIRARALVEKAWFTDIPKLEKKIGTGFYQLSTSDKEYQRLKSELAKAYELEDAKKDFRDRQWMTNVFPKAQAFKAWHVSQLAGSDGTAELGDPTKRGGLTYELVGSHAGKDVYARLDSNCISNLSSAHYDVYRDSMQKGVIPGSSTGSDGIKFESYGWVVKITIAIANANQGMDNTLSPKALEDRDDVNNAIYLNFNQSVYRH